MTRAWLSGGSVPSGVRLFSVIPSSWAVASSLLRVQLAMSPAPTSATVTVCPKTGTATTTAAAHASTTHAAYLAASLRTSTALNPLLSMSEDAISPSPCPAHGSGLVASNYGQKLVTCPDVARCLVLLLRGRLTGTGIHRSRALAAGAGGT